MSESAVILGPLRRVAVGAEEVQRDVRLVADDPAVVVRAARRTRRRVPSRPRSPGRRQRPAPRSRSRGARPGSGRPASRRRARSTSSPARRSPGRASSRRPGSARSARAGTRAPRRAPRSAAAGTRRSPSPPAYARGRVADRGRGHRRGERADRQRRRSGPPAAGVAGGDAEGDVAVDVGEHRVDRAGDAGARHPRDPRAGRLVERRVGHHADQRRVALLELASSRAARPSPRSRRRSSRPPRRPASIPASTVAVVADHVAERVDDRERRDPVAEARASRPRSRPRSGSRCSRPAILPTAAPVPGADPARARARLAPPPRTPRSPASASGRAARVAGREVVDHRRGHDRDQAARGRVAAPLLLAPAHRRRRRRRGRRRCRRSSMTAVTSAVPASGPITSVSRVPGPPPRTSTPPRAPGGAITAVQPVTPSASVQWPIRKPSGGGEPTLTGRAARRARPRPQPPLAAGAEVGRAARDDDPPDLLAAAQAGLALAGVDEELVLHRAALAARVAVVVDRRAAEREPGLERVDDPVAQLLGVLEPHRARPARAGAAGRGTAPRRRRCCRSRRPPTG